MITRGLLKIPAEGKYVLLFSLKRRMQVYRRCNRFDRLDSLFSNFEAGAKVSSKALRKHSLENTPFFPLSSQSKSRDTEYAGQHARCRKLAFEPGTLVFLFRGLRAIYSSYKEDSHGSEWNTYQVLSLIFKRMDRVSVHLSAEAQ